MASHHNPNSNMAIKKSSHTPLRSFHWMGEDHTETSVENLAMMRDYGSGSRHRYRHREDRQLLMSQVRIYLDLIKKELYAHDVEAMRSGASMSGLPPPPEDNSEAALNVSGIVRGSQFRKKRQLVSCFDGTFHDGPDDLEKYNSFCLATLTKIYAKRERLNRDLKRDPDRRQRVPQTEVLQAEETDKFTLPTEAEYALSVEETAVFSIKPSRHQDENYKQREEELRTKYNDRAGEMAKKLLSFNLVRNADLQGTYRLRAATGRPTRPSMSPSP